MTCSLTNPRDRHALLAYAGALDFVGREADAALAYEQAFAAGLDGDDLRQGLIQYGSTLRNLERFDDAVTALRQADDQFLAMHRSRHSSRWPSPAPAAAPRQSRF